MLESITPNDKHNKARLDGVGAIGNTQFFEHPVQVRVDRPTADAERFGDLLVVVSLKEETHDLAFAERELPIVASERMRLMEGRHEYLDCAPRQRRAIVHDAQRHAHTLSHCHRSY